MNINNRLRRKIRVGLLYGLGLACLAMILLCQPHPSYSLTPSEVPNPRQVYGGWVTDMADVLSNDTETRLNQMISDLEATNGAEIAIVTVPETQPSSSPKAFTTELFNTWGIGKAGDDNGILFLTSVGDRRVEIETGYGMEGILPDARVGRIIDTKIKPHFKTGDFDRGTLAGTEALIRGIQNQISNSPPDTEPKTVSDPVTHTAPNSTLPQTDTLAQAVPSESINSVFPAFTYHSSFIWPVLGCFGGLSYLGYKLARHFSRQPILVNPGESCRIKTLDSSDRFINLSLRIEVFGLLFILTLPAIFLILKVFPPAALPSGILMVAFLLIWVLHQSQSGAEAWKKFKPGTGAFLVMPFIFAVFCVKFIWLYPPSFDLISFLLLAAIFTVGEHPSLARDKMTFTMILGWIFQFIWFMVWASILRTPHLPVILEILSGSIGNVNGAIFGAFIVSILGCHSITRYWRKWQFSNPPNVRSLRPMLSATSQTPLKRIDRYTLTPLLTEHERSAQELESVSFEGWWSPEWGQINRDTIYLKAYVQNGGNGYSQCPVGEELTVECTSKVVKYPTTYSKGIRKITYCCYCCDYQTEVEQKIPRKSSSSSSSSGSSSSGGYSGGGYGGGYSGGGSSGGGSFGGGESGGGGAGGGF